MTNETAPERIWLEPNSSYEKPWELPCISDEFRRKSIAYVREDISEIRTERVIAELEAAQARIAELEGALKGALTVIDDYLGYEHDGDPWTEDARQMGEMDINEYQRDGRLEAARAALEGKG